MFHVGTSISLPFMIGRRVSTIRVFLKTSTISSGMSTEPSMLKPNGNFIFMPNVKLITLTPSVIQANINRLTRIINELDYYKKGIGRANQKKIIVSKNSYISTILEKGSVYDGMPCIKCMHMILPGVDCYAKYKHRGLVSYPSYYCKGYYATLYH